MLRRYRRKITEDIQLRVIYLFYAGNYPVYSDADLAWHLVFGASLTLAVSGNNFKSATHRELPACDMLVD